MNPIFENIIEDQLILNEHFINDTFVHSRHNMTQVFTLFSMPGFEFFIIYIDVSDIFCV